MVSKKETGYMISFSIYTGSECNELMQRNATMDPICTITKTVMRLLNIENLLDMHWQVWFDNWFNSVELLIEMLAHSTYRAGTVRPNCKGLPKAILGKTVKLKCFETVCNQNDHLLCLHWCD